jgi:hypothetical protein
MGFFRALNTILKPQLQKKKKNGVPSKCERLHILYRRVKPLLDVVESLIMADF